MVRLSGVVGVLAALAPCAAADDYRWGSIFGHADHACIVENALALRPDQTNTQDAIADWTSPKSFKLEVYYCPNSREEVNSVCNEAPADSEFTWVIRTPRLYAKPHDGWNASQNDFFWSDIGETFYVSDAGRFDYSRLNVTVPGNHLAWFTMTGTCTPFE